jgi:hypothetical protein
MFKLKMQKRYQTTGQPEVKVGIHHHQQSNGKQSQGQATIKGPATKEQQRNQRAVPQTD